MNTATGYVVVDVETSGIDPAGDRVLSIAALALGPDGSIERTLHTLLDPGVDPGPTDIHGLTTAMLAGKPRYEEVAGGLAGILRGRIFVAHNAAFDYAFLAAESRRCNTDLPIAEVLCTLDLARRLDLGVRGLRLADLAAHWRIPQAKPHDALDDARVLAGVLTPALACAARQGVPLPIRSPETLTQPPFRRAA